MRCLTAILFCCIYIEYLPVGTRSRNSGNSGNGSTGSPRFGGVFFSGHNINSMSLSSVFVDVGVYELYDIESDGGGENGG